MKTTKLRIVLAVAIVVIGFALMFYVLGWGYHGDGITPQRRTSVTRALPETGAYIGNGETKKFHYFYCSYLPDAENQIPFDSRDEAIAAGYTPCGHCHP